MRLILLAAIAFAPLAACGQSEEAFRNSFRQASIDSCVSGARTSAPPQAAGWDWPRLCTCATDRIMAGKSAADLARLETGTPEQQAALRQCLAEVQGITVPEGAGAPAGTAAPANAQ